MIASVLVMFMLVARVISPGAPAPVTFDRPGLVTSVGQSSDIAIVKVIVNTHLKLGLGVKPLATVADLAGVKTLVVVVGASTKGLGAAGLDAEKEAARGAALLKAARDKGLKVLVLHIGGESRRGKTSNDMIAAAMPFADLAVVVAAGNKDRLFDTLAAKRNTPLVEAEKITALAATLETLFN